MKHYKPLRSKFTPDPRKLPVAGEAGAFGAIRTHDIHSGVDLYCELGDPVFAMEGGIVVAVEAFTGPHADSPWWNDTWAVLIEGASGVFCYGELVPSWWIVPGVNVVHGELIGNITPVLKKDKGVNPPNMLHLELYKPGTKKSVWWRHGEEQPEELLDPTEILKNIYTNR